MGVVISTCIKIRYNRNIIGVSGMKVRCNLHLVAVSCLLLLIIVVLSSIYQERMQYHIEHLRVEG